MINLIYDFKEDIKKNIKEIFDKNFIIYDYNEDIHKLLMQFYNLVTKKIPMITHTVLMSKEIVCKKNHKLFNIVLNIKNKLEKGYTVNPHLSKKVIDANYYDKLMLDWNIFHFHLSNVIDRTNNNFYERTNDLLFAYIDENKVFFLDILPHKIKDDYVFARQELLEIIDNNWPNVLEKYRQQGVIGLTQKLSNIDIKKLRDAGAYAFVEVNNKVYIPMGGGINTARTGIKHVIWADCVLNRIRDYEEYFNNNKDSMFINESGDSEQIHDVRLNLKITRKGLSIIVADNNQIIIEDIMK